MLHKVEQIAIVRTPDLADEALFVNGDLIKPADLGEGDSTIFDIAESLSQTMGVPLTNLEFKPGEDWAWDDATPETVDGLIGSRAEIANEISDIAKSNRFAPEDLDSIVDALAGELTEGINANGLQSQLAFIATFMQAVANTKMGMGGQGNIAGTLAQEIERYWPDLVPNKLKELSFDQIIELTKHHSVGDGQEQEFIDHYPEGWSEGDPYYRLDVFTEDGETITVTVFDGDSWEKGEPVEVQSQIDITPTSLSPR